MDTVDSERPQTARDILSEYVDFDDVNGRETVELLPLTIVDAMIEYAAQFNRLDTEAIANGEIEEVGREASELMRGLATTTENEKFVARQMYNSLSRELVEIARENVGKSWEEIGEYDRVKEIWDLTDLLEKVYNI